MAKTQENNSDDKIRVTVDFQPDLYERFENSQLRRECNTDSEAIRNAIKKCIELENDC